MAKKKPEPKIGKKQYKVGTEPGADFHPAEMEALALKIAKWYSDPRSGRRYDDALSVAKEHIRQCLLAETDSGSYWPRCPAEFKTRIRVKCIFDMDKDEGIPRGRANSPTAERILDPAAQRAAREAMGEMDPVAAAVNIEQIAATHVQHILDEYPELDNPVHLPNVERLAEVYAQQQIVIQEMRLLGGRKKRLEHIETLGKLEQSAERTMKLLDIHPEQLRKKMDSRRDGTIGELISILESDENFAERERLWAMEAALQMWWMTQHRNGRGDAANIEDWELWHATRTRPIDYTCACGRAVTLVEGFTPLELRDYLIKRGVLVAEPAIPGLIPAEALQGIDGEWEEDGDGRGILAHGSELAVRGAVPPGAGSDSGASEDRGASG